MGHHPARAMYDQLEDGLISITRQLRSAIEADAGRPGRVNGKPQAAAGALERASSWAREVSAELGSVLLDTLGLAATIEWHVRQFQRCTGVLYELTVNDTAGFDLPDDYAATIFDVYTEALSNVARHSGARRVAVALTITPHEVTLVVRDDGIGLGKDAPVSVGGFAAMRARSKAYKGVCEVAGTRSAGTTVAVSLPIPLDQRP
jgi:signal transduction histidine kinase